MSTYGTATWKSGLKDGIGAVSTKSGALKSHPYGFVARFEGGPGTNPEELLGAAHCAVGHSRRSRHDRRADGHQARRQSGEGRRRLRHHQDSPDAEGENSGRRQGRVRRMRAEGQGRRSVSKLFKGAEITLDTSLV